MSNLSNLVNANLLVPVGKNGKVSRSIERVASVMAEASAAAVISAAVYGKGAAKKLAVMQLTGLHTVEHFTGRSAIDGGEWSDFLMALVARHGEKTYNPTTMKGKSGVVSYMRTTVSALELKGACDGWTEALSKKMAAAEEDAAHADRLMFAAVEAAAKAAEGVQS